MPPNEDDISGFGNPHGQNGGAKTPTILVVEDEFLIRLTLADYLRECGFRVLEVSNAREAQQAFRAAEPIELMISDVTMPGMDGVALAEWVQTEFPDVQIVLVSGQPSNRTRVSGVTFLQKPFAMDSIEKLVRQLLAR